MTIKPLFFRFLALFVERKTATRWIILFFLLFSIGLFSRFSLNKEGVQRPKIYDCFLFFNELELLTIRLNEMDEGVDYFVLVEAAETFRGTPKSLYFSENRQLFEQFKEKIIHVVVDEHFETGDPWLRERYQREQIFRGLKGCQSGDIILLSDVDEIVRKENIKEIVEVVAAHKVEAVVCGQSMYCGYLNRYQGEWSGTVCTTFKEFKRMSTKLTRRLRNLYPHTLKKAHLTKVVRLPAQGWHFSSMGGIDRYITKIESFSHAELDNPEAKKRERFRAMVSQFPLVEIDATFPKYVQDNRAYFEQIGFLDLATIN